MYKVLSLTNLITGHALSGLSNPKTNLPLHFLGQAAAREFKDEATFPYRCLTFIILNLQRGGKVQKATQFPFFTMIIRREKDVFFLHLMDHETAFAHKRLRTEAGTTSSKIPIEDYGLVG